MNWNLRQTYTQLPNEFYEPLNVSPVKAPKLVVLNEELAKSLNLDPEALKETPQLEVLVGNALPKETTAIAQAYAGHQFGNFTMLGDGRALLLGEKEDSCGQWYDLQLKGSGKTKYSRGGDGRAALGPMLREYIISEALHALGIPTTRSLSVVSTGEWIQREKPLEGAVMTRVAKSHLRVGTFEYAASVGRVELLRALADYTIKRHYPECFDLEEPYSAFLECVASAQASLVAKWQLIGFIHGVMNTDNMTISGESIDFGPCAFMDTYDMKTVFSSIDVQGRYAFGNQPSIGQWNLTRLAEALLPLLASTREEGIKKAEKALETYGRVFNETYLEGMKSKLGLRKDEEGDQQLIVDLFELMTLHKADYTKTFADLSTGDLKEQNLYETDAFKTWLHKWYSRLEAEEVSLEDIYLQMKKVNPSLIPRNHLVEKALDDATKGDFLTFEVLLEALKNPFGYTEQQLRLNQPITQEGQYKTYCGT